MSSVASRTYTFQPATGELDDAALVGLYCADELVGKLDAGCADQILAAASKDMGEDARIGFEVEAYRIAKLDAQQLNTQELTELLMDGTVIGVFDRGAHELMSALLYHTSDEAAQQISSWLTLYCKTSMREMQGGRIPTAQAQQLLQATHELRANTGLDFSVESACVPGAYVTGDPAVFIAGK